MTALRTPINRTNEAGFTLIELIVVTAIFGILMVGIVGTYIQTANVSAASKNHMQAINYAQTAGQWIVRDGQQAQTVTEDDPATASVTEVLTLVWDYSSYGLGAHTVHYSLDGTKLVRSDNGGDAQIIAPGIVDPDDFDLQGITLSDGSVFYTVQLKATTGGYQSRSATLSFYFKPRLS